MGIFRLQLGKGLREPCPPYRAVNVYGAPLNSPDASGYNCLPEVVSPASAFDLSSLVSPCEVCVALLVGQELVSGTYTTSIRWYRPNASLPFYIFTRAHSITPGHDFYTYSYVGYVAWEIDRNGEFLVEADVTGPQGFSTSQRFVISGSRPIEVPISSPGEAIGVVARALESASAWCYSVYLQICNWVFPISLIASLLKQLSVLFDDGASALVIFGSWVDGVVATLLSLLTWDGIKKALIGWLPDLEGVIAWFSDWWNLVKARVEEWWSGITSIVQGWIDVATQGLVEVIAGWNNFWVNTFPNLINWTGIGSWWNTKVREVAGLIDTAFTTREKFWAGWAEIRTTVLEFFADPLEWLWGKFADWFLGPE